MSFQGFFYFQLWHPFCSAEPNNFSNFGRGSPKEHFYEMLWQLVCSESGKILAFFVEGRPRNISAKLF